MRVCVCGVQIPFSYGGAEILVHSLAAELRARGVETETVFIPFTWPDRTQLFKSCLAWRLLDLTEVEGQRIDRVIATRFPSYLVKHPNKVVWLVHQLRQAYDLHGTPYSDFGPTARDERALEMIRAMDLRTLSEARRLYAISDNVAQRLERGNGLEATTLYPPPRLSGQLKAGPTGDFIFTVGRLNKIKRFDLLIRALERTETPVRAVIAGRGPEQGALSDLARRLKVEDRVEFLDWADDARVVELYSQCLAVFYAPYDEDYGYVTVEACLSGKPVVTTADAGGVLEFVTPGESGYVCRPDSPSEIAAAFDDLYRRRGEAERLGLAARRRVEAIDWDHTIEALLS